MQITTNAERMVEKAKFNKFHGMLLFWGALLMLFDGYDLVVYGAVFQRSWRSGEFLLFKRGCMEVMPYSA